MEQSAAAMVQDFWNWWRAELRAAAPFLFARRGEGDGATVISLIEPGRYRLSRPGAPAPIAEGGADVIAAACAARSGRGRRILRLPAASVFVRAIRMPERAAPNLRRLLTIDIEGATPFSPDDILFDYVADAGPGGDGMRGVVQTIAKRALVEDAIADLSRWRVAIDAVDAVGSEGINLSPRARAPAAMFAVSPGAAVLAACAVLATVSIHYRMERVERELTAARQEIEAETREVRAAASEARAAAEDIEALAKRQEAYPPALATLASLTAALDDSVSLNEVTIDGQQISVAGRSSSAANVVNALERSGVFEEVAFASAVTTDAESEEERFSLKMRVRAAPAPATPSGEGALLQ